MLLLEGAGKGRSYALAPAIRFLKLVGAEVDPHRLLGKVKTEEQLRSLGAELLGASVLLGEVGYEVQPGFLADANAVAAAVDGPVRTRCHAEGSRGEPRTEKRAAEARALASFSARESLVTAVRCFNRTSCRGATATSAARAASRRGGRKRSVSRGGWRQAVIRSVEERHA